MSALRVEKREGEERLLEDFIHYSMRAVRGLGSIAEEEGRELVRRMVEIGRVTPDEGEKLLATLLYRMSKSKGLFEKRVEEIVNRAVERLSKVSSKEIETLKERISVIDRRIDNLVSKKKDYNAII